MKKLISIILAIMFLASIGAAYAADGDIIWSKIYDSNDNEPYGVAVDRQNNVIVTGDGGTVKYGPDGNELWAHSIYGNDVAVDSNNNIILTDGSETMKYDPNGNPLWASAITFGGEAVVVDSNNNIIVTGSSGTRKYDSTGTPLWPSAIGISGDDVALDSHDNIIVIGDGDSYFIEKRDPNGNMLWDKTIDITSGSDYGVGVAVDSHDNIVVTGWVNDPDPSINYASCTIKLATGGTEIWRIYDNSGSRWSYKVAIDSYDNIVLAGGKYDPSGEKYQWLTVKYDSNGRTIWERDYDFTLGAHDDAYDVAVDSQNNIVVTGYVYNDTEENYFTIKYQGVPPRSKSLPIAQILKILKLNKEK